MKVRIFSGIALILIFSVLLIAGGPVLLCALFILNILALFELYNAMQRSKQHQPFRITGMVASFVLYVCLLLFKEQIWNGHFILYFFTLLMIVLMVLCLVFYPKRGMVDAALTVFSIAYVSLLFSYVYLLRTAQNGQFYVWYIFAASWGCDTCAYFTGYYLGKHKLSPVLSPKKTIEGAVGGVVGSILLCTIYGMIIAGPMEVDRGVILKVSLLIGLLGSLVAQVGDIFASSIKRMMKIKDYGNLIPGHGGILDRFDSLLLVAPIIVTILEVFKVIG